MATEGRGDQPHRIVIVTGSTLNMYEEERPQDYLVGVLS